MSSTSPAPSSAGWLTDRVDARRLLAVVFTLRGLLPVALPPIMSATVTPPMMAFVVLFGLLDLATVPPVIALCRRFHGDGSAIVFGWTSAAHQVGAALAAFLGGVARDAFAGYGPVWSSSARRAPSWPSPRAHRPPIPGRTRQRRHRRGRKRWQPVGRDAEMA